MVDNPPLISVCIANYNGMEVIDDCLRSIFEQEGHLPVEILVHDDASSDGSVSYIRDRYPDARLIVSDSNVGFCVANNRMVAAARGKYLLLLNNDAALFPDAVQTLLQEADRIGGSAILGLPQYDAGSGEMVDMGSLLDPFLNPVPNLDLSRNEVGMIIGACLWVPKELWNELGGFPEWFGSIGEDLYLCCRARLAGYAVRALAVSGYRHWQGKSFGGNKVVENRLATTFRRRALSERNKCFVMVLAYPTPLLQLIFPMHLALLLVEGFLLSLLKKEWRVFQDIYGGCLQSLWSERKNLFRLRRQIQADRTISWRTFIDSFTWCPHKLRLLLRHGVPHVG
ncbi:glycosyltransferase [Polaromonas sp.]|uniref:glycosyltransferase family 2 protein n=1 Tax=Polaromonas sp. TaxID=1869339 RepID=UPI003267EE42